MSLKFARQDKKKKKVFWNYGNKDFQMKWSQRFTNKKTYEICWLLLFNIAHMSVTIAA